jgi:hypothetical protein
MDEPAELRTHVRSWCTWVISAQWPSPAHTMSRVILVLNRSRMSHCRKSVAEIIESVPK